MQIWRGAGKNNELYVCGAQVHTFRYIRRKILEKMMDNEKQTEKKFGINF